MAVFSSPLPLSLPGIKFRKERAPNNLGWDTLGVTDCWFALLAIDGSCRLRFLFCLSDAITTPSGKHLNFRRISQTVALEKQNLSFKTSRCRNGRRHSSALDASRTSHPYHRTDEWGANGRDEWRATPLLHFYRSKQRGRCRRVHYKAQRGGARNTAATKLAQASRRRGGTGVGRHLADRSRQSPRIEWHSIISSCYD